MKLRSPVASIMESTRLRVRLLQSEQTMPYIPIIFLSFLFISIHFYSFLFISMFLSLLYIAIYPSLVCCCSSYSSCSASSLVRVKSSSPWQSPLWRQYDMRSMDVFSEHVFVSAFFGCLGMFRLFSDFNAETSFDKSFLLTRCFHCSEG
jgi:hypothetical protein